MSTSESATTVPEYDERGILIGDPFPADIRYNDLHPKKRRGGVCPNCGIPHHGKNTLRGSGRATKA